MPPPYKKEKLILKIYIRLLLYIKEKYNEIKNPDALLQHLTDMALDKTFYDLFTTAAQIELETAKKRELETAKKRDLETVPKIEEDKIKQAGIVAERVERVITGRDGIDALVGDDE
jgi:hypothetical protein